MWNNDQVSSVFWFFIGVIVISSSIPYGFGEARSPGSGFVPFFTGLAICTLSGIGFCQATIEKRRGKKWKNFLRGYRWNKPLITLASLVIYALLIERMGFLLDTTLLVGFLLRVIEPQKWSVVIVGALITSSAMYLVFKVCLKTQLPVGALGF